MPTSSTAADVTFRTLVEGDLRLLHRWLNEPGVVRWWEGEDVSYEAVVRGAGPDSGEDCGQYLALLDGDPVGWIQLCDPFHDDAEPDAEYDAWWAHGVPRTAGGIDYLVGEPNARGRGLGAAMIDAFVEQVVFAQDSHFTHAVASPQLANEASWKALARAGFEHVADYDDEVGPCRIMLRARD